MTRRNKPLLPQRNLGKIPSHGYRSSIRFAPEKVLCAFVENEVTEGPQIISLPVPSYRHAFLIDVQQDKIMICDWNGSSIRQKTKHEKAWNQYWDFFKELRVKYPRRPLTYYHVDKKLHDSAKRHEKAMGGGGCSYYLFAWIPQSTKYEKWVV